MGARIRVCEQQMKGMTNIEERGKVLDQISKYCKQEEIR